MTGGVSQTPLPATSKHRFRRLLGTASCMFFSANILLLHPQTLALVKRANRRLKIVHLSVVHSVQDVAGRHVGMIPARVQMIFEIRQAPFLGNVAPTLLQRFARCAIPGLARAVLDAPPLSVFAIVFVARQPPGCNTRSAVLYMLGLGEVALEIPRETWSFRRRGLFYTLFCEIR